MALPLPRCPTILSQRQILDNRIQNGRRMVGLIEKRMMHLSPTTHQQAQDTTMSLLCRISKPLLLMVADDVP